MSNLASVQRVVSLAPIEGADMIETCTILGWEIVVKKGEFKVGDLVAYIQIDTVVPETSQFEFLRERKFRVKTIKLRGQVSQGLIVPLPKGKWKEDDDLTDVLGIKKFEKVDNNPREKRPQMPKTWYRKWVYLFKYNVLYKLFPKLEKKTTSPFPTDLVPKTDEERIQNIPKVLTTHKGKTFVVSYKLDGSSITIIHDKGKFRICSRNQELHTADNEWHRTFESTLLGSHILKLVNRFKTDNIIVQGEMVGKPNGNHHALDKNAIYLFNIIVDGKRLSQDRLVEVCYQLNIPYCPVHCVTPLEHTMEEILKMSEIKDILNPKVEAEGLVWREANGTLSFKVINNKYLLKHE